MGASFNFFVLKSTTPSDAKKEGFGLIEDARYEYGHGGYTGTFAECQGVVVSKEEFKTTREAEDWLDENAKKWGPMVIVKGGDKYCAGAICSD